MVYYYVHIKRFCSLYPFRIYICTLSLCLASQMHPRTLQQSRQRRSTAKTDHPSYLRPQGQLTGSNSAYLKQGNMSNDGLLLPCFVPLTASAPSCIRCGPSIVIAWFLIILLPIAPACNCSTAFAVPGLLHFALSITCFIYCDIQIFELSLRCSITFFIYVIPIFELSIPCSITFFYLVTSFQSLY